MSTDALIYSYIDYLLTKTETPQIRLEGMASFVSYFRGSSTSLLRQVLSPKNQRRWLSGLGIT